MGKGDKKTKRGKIIAGSYGVRRSKKSNKSPVVVAKPEKIKEATVQQTETEKKMPVAKKTTAKKPASKKPATKKDDKNE
jgi:30S ribosomal protein S31